MSRASLRLLIKVMRKVVASLLEETRTHVVHLKHLLGLDPSIGPSHIDLAPVALVRITL